MPAVVGRDSWCDVPGARLNYIDWGGQGTPLILLSGLGDTAHVFDDLAPRLTVGHHVYAFTRRGFGSSRAFRGGYDARTLTSDITALMDALGIARADFVGHSVAGEELTALASTVPGRVRRLVYLDAAYDRSGVAAWIDKDPGNPRDPSPAALKDFGTFIAWRQRSLGISSFAVGNDIRSGYRPGQHGLVSMTPGNVVHAVIQGDAAAHPDYARVRSPAMALYSPKDKLEQLPPDASPARRRAALAFSIAVVRPWMLAEKARFEKSIRCGVAWEIKGAGHYLFLERPDDTAAWIRSFLSSSVPCKWSAGDTKR